MLLPSLARLPSSSFDAFAAASFSPPPPCSPPWPPHRSFLTMFLMLMLLLAGIWVLPLVVLICSICSRSWCSLYCCALRLRTAPRRCCTPVVWQRPKVLVGDCSSVLEEAEALTLVEVSLSASPEPSVSPS